MKMNRSSAFVASLGRSRCGRQSSACRVTGADGRECLENSGAAPAAVIGDQIASCIEVCNTNIAGALDTIENAPLTARQRREVEYEISRIEAVKTRLAALAFIQRETSGRGVALSTAPESCAHDREERAIFRKRSVALIVDLDDSRRLHLIAAFQGRGYETLEAKDAFGALQMAIDHHVDVLVTDNEMPGLTGRELIGIVRKHRAIHCLLLVTPNPVQIKDSRPAVGFSNDILVDVISAGNAGNTSSGFDNFANFSLAGSSEFLN
jgi:two-component system chemotaxis response regulator CheY